MTTELTITQQEVILKKRAAWSDLGESIHFVELALQKEALDLIALLIPPTNIKEVPQAEATLKLVKAGAQKLQDKRKEGTSRFDSITSRLMLPEKSTIEPINAYAGAIIMLKSAYEKEQAVVVNKAKEVVRIKEALLNQVNTFDANCKTTIAKLISDAYEYALGAGAVGTVEALIAYLKKVSAKITTAKFVFAPVKPSMQYLNEKEYAELVEGLSIPTDYVALFAQDLKAQFSDYETAFHNKEIALANQKKEAAEKAEAIADELANKNIAAKLDAISVPALPVSDVKALKKSYVIDMPETMENAMKILGAFIANYAACSAKLRITKAYNFSVGNAMKSLESLRNEDNAFTVEGIVWKELSKL